MESVELESLKKEIVAKYNLYNNEKDMSSFELLLKYFRIDGDINNLEIKEIDLDNLKLVVMDKSNGDIIESNYTSSCDLVNYSIGETYFINVKRFSDCEEFEECFVLDSLEPFISKMTFSDNGYHLSFTKEMPNDINFGSKGEDISISYAADIEKDDKEYLQPLFTKSAVKYDKECPSFFEQFFTYDMPSFIKENNTQDKYLYIDNDNVVYGINNHNENDCNYFHGICYESASINYEATLPIGISLKEFPNIVDKDNLSTMVFKGNTGNNNKQSLEIYKRNDGIHINYKDLENKNDEYLIDKLDEGTITIREVELVKESLTTKNIDNKFCELVFNELSNFSKSMKRHTLSDSYDILAPTLYFDRSFLDIERMILASFYDYFAWADSLFMKYTDMFMDDEKRLIK